LAGGEHGRDVQDARGLRERQRHALGLIDVDVLDQLHGAELMID
jgi:hypothetical protein